MATASGLISSIQSLSTKLLHAIRGTPSTLHQQQDPPSPVREDLEKLSRMLARIQAVLQDAEEREIHDRSVRLWLAELRGVAYQAEDVLDEFYYEVLRSIVEGGDAAIEAYHRDGGTKRKIAEMYASSSLASYSVTNTKASIPDGIAEKIKDITERFEEISNARENLHLREEDGPRLVIRPQIRPPTSSHVDEKAIFGREKDKEKIISLLNPSTGPDFMVLPIVGMGGFGKTTLAQLVFNDSTIHGWFKKRCWVSVSEHFDLVRLTKAIIDSLSEKPCEFSELNKLQDVLKEKISGHGHGLFLVLDDVWNEQRNLWECFRVGFLGAKFVRILTTTRNTSVAKIMQTTSPFQLGSLPEKYCWSLFKHFAFGNRETSENANLHEIGRGIVKKCKGSPLAIKALGGILCYEMDEEKWREILESDISEIDETGEVMPALRLSYQKLPQHLKPCFLYLSMFPKDFDLEKDMVIRLWMAQGYINGNTRNLKTLEEIGSEYFDELQGRSLVDGGPSSYILHDLIHDLARSVSQEAYSPVLEYNGPWKVCHLYYTNKDELMGLVPGNYRSIRTFVKEYRSEEFDFPIFSEIACVRALHLLYCSLYCSLQNTLGTFKHLRYLFVQNCEMEVLPKTLCLLFNLQTLDLGCDFLRELPGNIKNLINLRHFHLRSNKIQQLPESIFLLRNLRTLSLRYCTKLKELPKGIEQLTRLRILDLPKSLINMPCGIGKLPTLKQLNGHFHVMDHGMIGGLEVLMDVNKLSELLCKPGGHMLIINFLEENCPKLWKIGIIPQKVREVTFKYCPKLKLLTYPSVIKRLRIHGSGFCEIMFGSISESPIISKGMELISIDCMYIGFNYVTEVSFEYCPKLEHVTIPIGTLKLKTHECGFREIMFQGASAEYLTVSNCIDLFSINWMGKGINSIREINFKYCPKLELQLPVNDVLPSMTQRAEIYDSPRMNLDKRYVYQVKRDTMTKVLSLFGNNEIHLSHASVNSTIPLLDEFFTLSFTKEDFREVESLTWAPLVGVSCQCTMLNLASLVILEITMCTKVISVEGLDKLRNLKRLSISYCPELCNWNDKILPLSLSSLRLCSCHKLSSFPLLWVQNNSNILKVLVIKRCPRLALLEGFHCLTKLETVNLLDCRNISISPATESLQLRPHFTIGDCPLMREWCQKNNITYYQLSPIDNPQDDMEAEQESAGTITKG